MAGYSCDLAAYQSPCERRLVMAVVVRSVAQVQGGVSIMGPSGVARFRLDHAPRPAAPGATGTLRAPPIPANTPPADLLQEHPYAPLPTVE